MRAIRWMASLLLLAALSLSSSPNAAAQDAAAAGGTKQQPYTMAEYNSYQAAAAEKNPASQIKLLDDFVAKYPNSALLNYIYPLYYKNYYAQKNYPKAIEYADKMIAMGDKISPAEKYDAHYVRAYAFNAIQNPDPETAKAARAAALAGLKILDQLPKPDGEDDAKFAAEKKQSLIVFNGTAATAGMAAKDYAGAIESYKAVLALAPDDLVSNYKLGQAYMAIAPPQQLDAIWYFARAATSKSATEQQSKSVKSYIRKVIAVYQGGTVCDTLTDAEMNELLQLAPNSVDRGLRPGIPRRTRQAAGNYHGDGHNRTQDDFRHQRRGVRSGDHAEHGRDHQESRSTRSREAGEGQPGPFHGHFGILRSGSGVYAALGQGQGECGRF